SLAIRLLYVAAIFQVFDAGNVVARGVLRGVGDVRFAAVVGIGCAWLFIPTLTWYLGGVLGMGAVGAWLSLCGEIIAGAAIFWWRIVRTQRVPRPERSPVG